jgi:hypothetical protein
MEAAMSALLIRSCSLALAALSFLVLTAADASAQDLALTNQTRPALNFYGGRSAYNTLSEMPRRSPIQPASGGQLQHNGKPFRGASTGPTISPYLNLFRDERGSTDEVPSYYTFVRPQLEQQATYLEQQREIEQLQRQVQGRPVIPRANVTGSGTRARYMDTAQFYGGWQR